MTRFSPWPGGHCQGMARSGGPPCDQLLLEGVIRYACRSVWRMAWPRLRHRPPRAMIHHDADGLPIPLGECGWSAAGDLTGDAIFGIPCVGRTEEVRERFSMKMIAWLKVLCRANEGSWLNFILIEPIGLSTTRFEVGTLNCVPPCRPNRALFLPVRLSWYELRDEISVTLRSLSGYVLACGAIGCRSF